MVVVLKQEASQHTAPNRLGVYRSETNPQLGKMWCSEMYMWGGSMRDSKVDKERRLIRFMFLKK